MVKSLPTGPEPAGRSSPKLARPLRTFGPSKRSTSAKSSPKSLSPHPPRKNPDNEARRSQSLSPSKQQISRPSNHNITTVPASSSLPVTVTLEPGENTLVREESLISSASVKKISPLLQTHTPGYGKLIRALTTKKRDFFKLRKAVMLQQNLLVEQFASLKETEKSLGQVGDDLGDLRVVAVSNWPPHDLLLMVRDEIKPPVCNEVGGVLGPEFLQQIHTHLSPIPFEVGNLGRELLERRYSLIVTIRGKHRADRSISATEWKAKNADLDAETEELTKMVEKAVSSTKHRVQASFDLARNSWIDRDRLIKMLEKAQRDIVHLQCRSERMHEKEVKPASEPVEPAKPVKSVEGQPQDIQTLLEELQRERAHGANQKEMLSSAEGMLRNARSKIVSLERQLLETREELEKARRKQKELEQVIVSLERQLKETRAGLETSHRKQKELKQIHRFRETNIDARSKKLLEVSKTGEVTIEQLQRQRDALELRVKELREAAAREAREAAARHEEQRSRADNLHAKVARQGKELTGSQKRIQELEARVKELVEETQIMRDRSTKLVEISKQRCVDFLPNKETEPSERETEMWKELQVTRAALSKTEEELHRCRADKDSFLNSLSRIAQGEGSDNPEDKMATELLESERKICRLKEKIREHEQNEKSMEQTMTQYENQLAGMKLEIKKLRSYYHYVKEVPHQELQAELLELQMQVSALRSQRTALVSAAASRALMLERHERAAECFARVTRTRHELAALAYNEPRAPSLPDVSHSLSAIRSAGAETWSALKSERNRVLSLERAVLSQNLQLEREGRVRTQLERRRAFMERELMWPRHPSSGKYVDNRLDMLSMGSRTTSSGRSYE